MSNYELEEKTTKVGPDMWMLGGQEALTSLMCFTIHSDSNQCRKITNISHPTPAIC